MKTTSEAVKLERERRRTAREDRLWQLLLNPNVIRVATVGALLFGAREIRDSKASGGTKAVAVATATIGIPLIAADAGVRDKWALAALAAIVGGVTGVESSWLTPNADTEIVSAGGESVTIGEGLLGIAGGGVPTWYNPFDRDR